jgi:hypothetical protein
MSGVGGEAGVRLTATSWAIAKERLTMTRKIRTNPRLKDKNGMIMT